MTNHWGDFCTYCGQAVNGNFPRRCDNGHVTYASPVTVGVALQPVQCEDRIGILVVRRGIEPHKGDYALPGGFADREETARLAAMRELFEETGIKAASATYFCEDIGSSHNPKDPRRHTMYFYAMDTFNVGDIDLNFHDSEVQELQLVFLSADQNELETITGAPITLCFSTHHKAAIRFLREC